MDFETVVQFRTLDAPELKRGVKLLMKFATVVHFRTPESPEMFEHPMTCARGIWRVIAADPPLYL